MKIVSRKALYYLLPPRILALIILLCTVIISPLEAQTPESVPFVISGVVVNSGSAELVNHFVQILSTKSGYPMKPVYVKSYAELSRVLRDNPAAVGWTCGAPYVEDSIKDGQQLISIPLFNHKPLYFSLIISHKDDPLRSLAEFKGKIFAYSDPRSNSGFVAPSYHLKLQDIDIKKHFRLLLHAGNHERSIEAMANGLADVAAIDEYVWIDYIKKHPDIANSLHEIERLGPFPFTPIVAGRQLDKKVIEKLQHILSNMNKTKQGKKILDEFGFDGFVNKKPEFYQPIQNMLNYIN
jgi:phosphonate transport system substrate-binding protein